jgi:hypothetical protein
MTTSASGSGSGSGPRYEVETYTLKDEELLSGFVAVAPIVRDQEQFAHAMTTPQGEANLISALLYFSLGVRFSEHVHNHKEWLDMLANAGDPQHPQIALPGFDFDITAVMADVAKRLR